jgi:hypothetical protein
MIAANASAQFNIFSFKIASVPRLRRSLAAFFGARFAR